MTPGKDFGVDVEALNDGSVLLTVRLPDTVTPLTLHPRDARHLARELDQTALAVLNGRGTK